MKKLIWFIIGAAAVCASGFTYEVTRAFVTENVVDVRIVEVGGHEYVVGTSFSPFRTCPSENAVGSGGKNANIAVCRSYSAGGGSAICLVHHAGCKACGR